MTATTCSSCGTPLPAVAADPNHPDRCPSCAARGAGAGPPLPGPVAPPVAPPGHAAAPAWPTAPVPTGPPIGPAGPAWGPASPAGLGGPLNGPPAMVTRTRWLEALIVGLAAAALAGAAWWGVVATTKTQFTYGAIAVGVLVGQGVLIGARKGGVGPAVLAVLASLTALAVAEYFIQRSLAIDELGADIPLWLGFSSARDVVEDALRGEPQTGLFWGIAALVAAISAGSRSRRPVI